MEGNPTISVDQKLELGWLEWGKKLKMSRKKYEALYKSCTYWSSASESPIECMLFDEVKKLGLDPLINITLGDLLLDCKRDIAGRFIHTCAGDRYDQVYLIKDGDRPVPILIVECDGGHHMKEKIIRSDAKKEHNLKLHFPHVLVLRFTGSQIDGNYVIYFILQTFYCDPVFGVGLMLNFIGKF